MTTIFRCGTKFCAHLHRVSARIGLLLSFLRSTPPIDVLSPPDPPEWDRELRRMQGLTETFCARCQSEQERERERLRRLKEAK